MRSTGNIVQPHKVTNPVSLLVLHPMCGDVAFSGAKRLTGTQKRYGAPGNRFVAVVELVETTGDKSLLVDGYNGTGGPRISLIERMWKRKRDSRRSLITASIYWPASSRFINSARRVSRTLRRVMQNEKGLPLDARPFCIMV